MAMLLGFGTAVAQASSIVEVRMAAPNVIVAVLTNLTYEPEGGTGPDSVDKTSWQVNGSSPTNVSRYSVTWDEGPFNDYPPHGWTLPVTTLHRLYLSMSSALQDGTGYTISHPTYGNASFTFHPTNIFCESIKVNQAGYSKLHTNRFANYGVFRGEGKSMQFSTLPTYKVYNENSGAVLTSGQAVYMGDDTGSAGFQVRNSGEYVYRLSLNGVPEGGPYYVSVDGAGRSRSFGIGDNYSSNIAYVTMRGMYLHRCGTALTEPYTAFTHAICHTNIYDSRSTGAQDNNLVNLSTDPPMFIQGGYHDAADMDQQGHAQISYYMLSFFESFPDRFITNQYNIPESGNGIPDFLNEIMWGVKVWEYLQVTNTSDPRQQTGGVREGWSGICTGYGDQDAANDTFNVPPHSSPHIYGTFAVTEDCTAMVAGIFAQASRLLRPYPSQAAHAADLLYRAQLAWTYLNTHYDVHQARARYAYSALQLYLATTNSYYHDIFQTAITSIMAGGGAPTQNGLLEWYAPGTTDAALNTAHFVSYLLPNVPNPNTTLQQSLKNNILYYTTHDTSSGGPPDANAYPGGIYNNVGGNWLQYGSGTSQGRYADVWMYSCLFTSDPGTLKKCTNAVCQYADFPLGLNPMGMSYYTGLGTDRPNSILDCNSYFTKYGVYDGVPLPDGTQDNYGGPSNPIGQVPGICVYGPQYDEATSPRDLSLEKKMVPYWTALPPQRRYTHGNSFPRVNEFTVEQTMVWNLLMYAFLYTPTNGVVVTPPPPSTTAQRATAAMTIDGNLSEAAWTITNTVTKTLSGINNNTVTFGALWDDTYLYVGARVLDANLISDSGPAPYQDDAIEIYIDGNYNRGTTYDSYDRQIVKGWNNPTIWANGNQTNGIRHAWAYITGGYSVEVAIPWTNFGITPNAGTIIGFDVGNDDDEDGALREGQSTWAGTVNNWTDTSGFGKLTLLGTNGPSGEFTNDVNTIALYHFTGNYNDSSANGFNLTAFGSVILTNNSPLGTAAHFSNLGDQLLVTIPDSAVEPSSSSQTPLSIEARIYVRGYKAYGVTNVFLIGLSQDYDAQLAWYDPIWPASGQPIGPFVVGSSSAYVLTASQWQNAVSLNAWHKFKLTFAADGTTACYIDDNLVNSVGSSILYWRTSPWLITLGNFDGDIDEVRISNVVR